MPGEFHGQRSLAGYSPWDHKESDRTDKQAMGEEREMEQESMRRCPKRNRKGGRRRERQERYSHRKQKSECKNKGM